MNNYETEMYDFFLKLVRERTSVRSFKSDPIPEGHIEKILETARWAMSGANSQPWEFIVVTDPIKIKQLEQAYKESNLEFCFWMEQQRLKELRHPAFQVKGDVNKQFENVNEGLSAQWGEAPAVIVVVGDGRRQWGTVVAGQTFGRNQSHFTDGLANASTHIHLAARALGLGSQWVTVHIEEPFRRILKVPDLLKVYLIIPVGYPKTRKKPARRKLEEMVHYNEYNLERYMANKDILEYIASLRQRTMSKYHLKEEGKSEN